MTEVRDEIIIDRDVRTVYDQWTRFEDFPEFMQGVERVEQIDDRRLHWEANIGGAHREWEAEITEQEPGQVLAWRATGDTRNDGRVAFEAESPDRTRVEVFFAYDPQGFVEKVGDALNIIEARVRGDLERFKQFVEERPAETDATGGDGQPTGAARPAANEIARDLTRPGESGDATAAHGEEPTGDELYERARELDVPGRSDMTKDELARAVARAEDGSQDGESVDAETSTKDELYERARELDVPGRSDMTKDELAEAIARRQSG